MKNIFFVLIFSVCVIAQAYSQIHQNLYIENERYSLFMQSNSTPGSTKFDAQYLNPDWEPGSMQTSDKKMISNVAFMYNVTNDKFEIRANVNPNAVGRITFNGMVFIYSQFIVNDQVRSGYFELLSEGRAVLLKRYSVKTSSGRKGAFGYDAYQNVNVDYYVKVGDKPAVPVQKKAGDFVKALSDHKEEVTAYIKKNQLKMIKKKDIIQLLNYYSTLDTM